MKTKNDTVRYSVGDILEVKSFAGPAVQKRVEKIIKRSVTWSDKTVTTVKGFEGVFVRRRDLYALKKNCVPYSGKEVLSKTSSFTFDWQIIKTIKSVR